MAYEMPIDELIASLRNTDGLPSDCDVELKQFEIDRLLDHIAAIEAHKRAQAADIMTLGKLVYDDKCVAWKARAETAEAELTAARAEIKCDVLTMQHSSGFPDYFSRVTRNGKTLDMYMTKIKGRAEYHAAEWNWLLNDGPKPRILDYRDDIPEGFVPPKSQAEMDLDAARERIAALEGVKPKQSFEQWADQFQVPDSWINFAREAWDAAIASGKEQP